MYAKLYIPPKVITVHKALRDDFHLLLLPALQNLPEVGSVTGFAQVLDGALKGGLIQEAHLEADFLQARDA